MAILILTRPPNGYTVKLEKVRRADLPELITTHSRWIVTGGR